MISALEHYGILDEHSSTATVSQDKPVETNDRALSPRSIDIGQILCTHGKLDPQKANDMKRISRVNPFHFDHISAIDKYSSGGMSKNYHQNPLQISTNFVYRRYM
jgi:hypothetical protein